MNCDLMRFLTILIIILHAYFMDRENIITFFYTVYVILLNNKSSNGLRKHSVKKQDTKWLPGKARIIMFNWLWKYKGPSHKKVNCLILKRGAFIDVLLPSLGVISLPRIGCIFNVA